MNKLTMFYGLTLGSFLAMSCTLSAMNPASKPNGVEKENTALEKMVLRLLPGKPLNDITTITAFIALLRTNKNHESEARSAALEAINAVSPGQLPLALLERLHEEKIISDPPGKVVLAHDPGLIPLDDPRSLEELEQVLSAPGN